MRHLHLRLQHLTEYICLLMAAVLLSFALTPSRVSAEAVDNSAEYSSESDAWENWPVAPAMYSTTAALIDAQTGAILYSKGGFAAKYPASITKVMTALLVLENDDLSGTVTMTEEGLADAFDGSSNCQPTLGETFSVEDCLKMLLVKSANDIATQLAVYTAGSVSAFADMMNAKAQELGCVNSHFVNASGLEDTDHYTCSYDMAVIMAAALKYDKFREIIAQQYVEIPATPYHDVRVYETHVDLMKDGDPSYEYCIGGKTGYTPDANCTLVCAAEKDGHTLCAVVMDVEDYGRASTDIIDMFEFGYNNFTRYSVYDGVPKLEEGGVTLPAGVSVEDLDEVISEGEDYVAAGYNYNGHYVGHTVMSRSDYESIVLGITSEPETQAAEEELSEYEKNAKEGDLKTTDAEQTVQRENASRSVPMPLVIILIIVTAAVAVYLILYFRARAVRKRRNRNRRNRNTRNSGHGR